MFDEKIQQKIKKIILSGIPVRQDMNNILHNVTGCSELTQTYIEIRKNFDENNIDLQIFQGEKDKNTPKEASQEYIQKLLGSNQIEFVQLKSRHIPHNPTQKNLEWDREEYQLNQKRKS